MGRKKKRTLVTVGICAFVFSWIMKLDFYINAMPHVIMGVIIVAAYGSYALVIKYEIIFVEKHEVANLRVSAYIWCACIMAASIVLLLQHEVFSDVPHLLIIYRIISAISYAILTISWLSLWWVGKKVWFS